MCDVQCGLGHKQELEQAQFSGIQAFEPYEMAGQVIQEQAFYLANCACGTTLAVPFDRLLHDDGGLR